MYALHSQLAGSISTISNLFRRIKWWHASTESECDALRSTRLFRVLLFAHVREKENKNRKEKKKRIFIITQYEFLFYASGGFWIGKKIFFFSKYVALSSLAKCLGAGFSEGDQKTRQEKETKDQKKKCFRVMTEGDSSEQQLIVILSRMRGWDFIAWSFRGVWDSSWEEKVIPFLRESAFWESGLHSFISRLKGSWESECSKSCWEVWMSFPVHGSDIMRISLLGLHTDCACT